jgi:hypothetical protein
MSNRDPYSDFQLRRSALRGLRDQPRLALRFLTIIFLVDLRLSKRLLGAVLSRCSKYCQEQIYLRVGVWWKTRFCGRGFRPASQGNVLVGLAMPPK